jgi:CRISP-associated protein Cas1
MERVRWQLETRANPEQRNGFCRSLVTKKIEASIIALEKSIRRSDKWERAMKSAYAALSRLEENPPENIPELRTLANQTAPPLLIFRGSQFDGELAEINHW